MPIFIPPPSSTMLIVIVSVSPSTIFPTVNVGFCTVPVYSNSVFVHVKVKFLGLITNVLDAVFGLMIQRSSATSSIVTVGIFPALVLSA